MIKPQVPEKKDSPSFPVMWIGHQPPCNPQPSSVAPVFSSFNIWSFCPNLVNSLSLKSKVSVVNNSQFPVCVMLVTVIDVC